MNKYIFKTILSAALAFPVLTSCELDQYPAGTIPAEEAWQSTDDANNFYIGLLSYLRSYAGTTNNAVAEIQADLFNQGNSSVSLNQEYDWTFVSTQFGGDGMWSGSYGLIMTANNILDNIGQVVPANEDEAATLRGIKGTAYFARAYAYSKLVTRYCKEYNAATADETLGLPLVLKVDVNEKPSRASLQATYDQIIEDLDSADVNMAGLTNFSDVTAPNANTAKALRARVYLNCKKYDEAVSIADELIAQYPLTNKGNLGDMWWNDAATSEIIYMPLLTTDERAGGTMGTYYFGYSAQMEMYTANYFPTQALLDLYKEEGSNRIRDARFDTFFQQTELCSGQYTGTGYIFYKFPGNAELRKGTENDQNAWYNMPKPFRSAELYLIAAEASYLKATPDEAAALAYLNALRTKRGASELTRSGDLLFKEIKNEWAREFCGEGFRLDCLKRWGDAIVRTNPQNMNGDVLRNEDPSITTELNITPEDARYKKIVWEIPSSDLQSNKNLKPNW